MVQFIREIGRKRSVWKNMQKKMNKIIIIGCPGSGKSTFARSLHSVTGLPLHHLDMFYWNADRTIVPKDIFMERLQDVMAQSQWIIDGNYGSTMEMRLQACDTVFFLDYPMDVCLEGIAFRRGKERTDMPWVEDKDEDEEFISFIRNYNTESRPEVVALLEKYADKNVFIFPNRDEASDFLERLLMQNRNSS